MPPTLVIISHYDRRPRAPLRRLVRALGACGECDVCVVVNKAGRGAPSLPAHVRVIERENTGMNIGAWEAGWRAAPGYAHYLFLQDECELARPDWREAYLERARDPAIGLLGEALNAQWDKPWDALARERAGERLPGHERNGQPMERVALYLDCMRAWDVDPGPTGRHLRSLTWFARRETLEAIGGFPIGTTYGECIAAEIAVSRKVEAAGLRVEQIAPEPFAYIRHAEWKPVRHGGPFQHARSRKPWWRRILR